MDQSWIDPLVWVVLAVISLGALATGVGLIFKSLSFQSQYLQSLVVGLVGTILFTAAGLLVPLAFFSGQNYQQDHLLADLMMFGISGLAVVGIVCFIIDHLNERPSFVMLAASASLAVVIFPWIYIAFNKRLNDQFKITIVAPEIPVPKGLDPLNGNRSSLAEADAAKSAGDDGDPTAGGGEFEPSAVALDAPPKLPENSSQGTDPGQKEGSPTDWLYDDP